MNWLRTVRMMVRGVLKTPSPPQVALAIALGIAVGVVPKGNLLALALGFLLCSLRLNLAVGLATAVIVSLVAHYGDVVFDFVGASLLESEALRPCWVWIAERPYSPWLQFNNTVVLGAFVVGVMQIYPAYRIALPACERALPWVEVKLAQSRLLKIWSRFEWSSRLSSSLRS